MSDIRAVIFDCSKTLVDIRTNEEKKEVFANLALYLRYYGADADERYLKSAIDQERDLYLRRSTEVYPEVDLEAVFMKVLRGMDLGDAFLAQSCCRLFRLLTLERFQLFPDTLPVLRELGRKGYILAVVSDAQKVFSLEECRMLGLHQLVDHFVMSTQYGFTKPDPRLFSIACTLIETPPGQAVYVGNDAEKDVKGARQVGMKTILVDRDSTGGMNKGSGADVHAADLWEALQWIEQYR